MNMKGNLLKLLIVGLFCVGFVASTFFGKSSVSAFSGGPEPSVTGAPGESTCSNCHGGGPSGGTLAISGLSNYALNQEFNVTVTLTQSNRGRYGFQLTTIDDTGKKAGDLTPTDARTQTQPGTVNGNQRQYINHTSAGVTPFSAGVGSWTFKWKAPAQSVGRITFYIAGNAANGNGSTGGDTIYTTSQSIQPGVVLTNVTSVSAASYANPGALTSEAIAAAFGTGLSQNTVLASSQPLPTQLDGVEVKVKDAMSMERNAPLFFVSPSQINYLVPTATSAGTATVTVRRSGNDIAQGTLPIEAVAPGLFSAASDGKGVAAAVVLRVRGAVQTFEPISQFNATTGKFDPIPIDLGPATDQVFFIGFGTGYRAAGPLNQLTSTIGGTPATVLAVAAVQGFTGLDQVNIGPIPRSLIGRGNVDIVFTANGKPANAVTMNVK